MGKVKEDLASVIGTIEVDITPAETLRQRGAAYFGYHGRRSEMDVNYIFPEKAMKHAIKTPEDMKFNELDWTKIFEN
eukprot:3512278-Amphidinium_carterae.1